ncbi:MAG: dockerin type I domain-containing protein [Dehalococcoidia bacterium]
MRITRIPSFATSVCPAADAALRQRQISDGALAFIGLVLCAALATVSLVGNLDHAFAATSTVNSTGDGGDVVAGDGVCETATAGECTLRAAIEEANAFAGTDTIAFNIDSTLDVGCDGLANGVCTITPASALPAITDPVTIDGYTQPGASANTNANGGLDTVLKIALEGSGCANCTGLEIKTTGGGSTIKGLNIRTFGVTVGTAGILAAGGGNLVEGNFVGTDSAGAVAAGMFTGVNIAGSSGNTIGGTVPGARNVISGNGHGVILEGVSATGNLVQGNLIGTDVNGIANLANGEGVLVFGAPANTIGGTFAGARNVISNNGTGVTIFGSDGTGNLVQGNFIGTDVNGTAALGNALGVNIQFGVSNTIGGTVAGARNVISGNSISGVQITGSGNFVQGNYIGTDVGGTAALGNSSEGVWVAGVADNTIGGTVAGAGNVISGNGSNGVYISGFNATGNLVEGNYIGTDVNGTAALGNSNAGVSLDGARLNTIGGTVAGARNVISGNDNGVNINGDSAYWNLVQGNFIGTDVNGTTGLANSFSGVRILAPANTIGGAVAGARNVISGNNGTGIAIEGSSAAGNLVQGNYVGTDINGATDLGNSAYGVHISDGASGNAIGGTGAGESNTIAFNTADGVRVESAGTTGNTIRGNSIHDNGGLGIENIDGGNTELTPPLITAVGSAEGTTTCEGCMIDVYSDGGDEGKVYEGSVSADTGGAGPWAWSFPGAVTGPNVTATVTDNFGFGNTSEFSAPLGGAECTDTDGDTICDESDNCPDDSNADQADGDTDGVGDECDNCPTIENEDQADANNNGIGDACEADVEVTSVVVNCPNSGDVGVTFACTVSVTVHNSGPAGPANVDLSVSISVPFDCAASPQGSQTSEDISLPVSVAMVITRTWSITCTNHSNHVITAGATITLDEAGWTDQDDSNNSEDGQDTLPVYDYTDVKVPSISVVAPTAVNPGDPFQIDITISIHNNGPVNPLNGEGGIGVALPPDCTKTPSGYQLFNPILLPVSTTVTHTESWTVTCTATGVHQVIACGRAGPVTLHVRELSTNNANANEHLTIEVGDGETAVHTGTSCSILGDPPEVCGNGVDEDQDGLVDEEPDVDGDGLSDCEDTDDDGDSYVDDLEGQIGTDPWNDCATHAFDKAWPPDFDNNRTINITDVLALKSAFGTVEGGPAYLERKDLTGDGRINISDVLSLKPPFGQVCS